MASFKMYRITTATTSTPYNLVTGTTSVPTVNTAPEDKGVSVIFQNQSTGAFNIWIGASNVTPLATSTGAGVVMAQNGTFQIQPRHGASAIVMSDYYICSTSSLAICTAMLTKMV